MKKGSSINGGIELIKYRGHKEKNNEMNDIIILLLSSIVCGTLAFFSIKSKDFKKYFKAREETDLEGKIEYAPAVQLAVFEVFFALILFIFFIKELLVYIG